ncbi:hypothetical protein CerSpe_012880 [Prunus speciosa]
MGPCRGDLALKDCHTYFNDSVSILLQCRTALIRREAIIWAQRCTILYSNISIFNVDEDEPAKFVPSGNGLKRVNRVKMLLRGVSCVTKLRRKQGAQGVW